MSKIKAFRGLMTNDTVEKIHLGTLDGKTGYKISKLQVMPANPTGENMEAVIKIYKVVQTATTSTINFSDNTMLAAAYLETHEDASSAFSNFTNAVIFDTEIFNQDIFVTLAGQTITAGLNYYLELEQMPLDLNEATVATLKNIKNRG